VVLHTDRPVNGSCPLTLRVEGPTGEAATVQGRHDIQPHEHTQRTLAIRAHLLRDEARSLFGTPPALGPAKVTVTLEGSDTCRAPMVQASGLALAPSATTTFSISLTSRTQPVPKSAFFAFDVTDTSQVLDVYWGLGEAGGLVPFVAMLIVPGGSVDGCPATDGMQGFRVFNPLQGPAVTSVQYLPIPAPSSGVVQVDGTFAMTANPDPCWGQATVTGRFSATPNAQGVFPAGTTVSATWTTGGDPPQTGSIEYPLLHQNACVTVGPQRCAFPK